LLPGWFKMKLHLILILAVLAYAVSSNYIIDRKIDDVYSRVVAFETEYTKDKSNLFSDIENKFQRVMDRYGTRLTLVEKGVKKYHGVETLDDLTERK